MGSRNDEVERLTALLLERDIQIAALVARVAELEKLIGRNSKNSSLPPSAEGFTKAPVNPNRARACTPGQRYLHQKAGTKVVAHVAQLETVQCMATPYTDLSNDPSRGHLDVGDPRLKRALRRDPERCATLNEYAQVTGMDVAEITQALSRYLDTGEMMLEVSGSEVFLHTAPGGREPGSTSINVPANLWEILRTRSDVPTSHALWQLLRSLNAVGWVVEHRLPRILSGLDPLRDQPFLGIVTAHVVVPLLIFSSPEALSATNGLLEQYARAGAAAVAVVCDERELDKIVTAARRWMITRDTAYAMNVLVLEAPRYDPLLLSAGDGSIRPVTITRIADGGFW